MADDQGQGRAGDVADVEKLYRVHVPAVYRLALALSGNATDADDITAKTFLCVWTARDRLYLSAVIGYLLTIARHVYQHGVRHAARRKPLDHDVVVGLSRATACVD